MTRPFAVLAFALLAALATLGAADPDPTAEATAAARGWLSVVDAGQYGESWDEAAALFKEHISKSQWERAVGDVRKQTGALNTRELESAQPAHQLPGVPDGDYVVIVYRSSFAAAPVATETVADAQCGWSLARRWLLRKVRLLPKAVGSPKNDVPNLVEPIGTSA